MRYFYKISISFCLLLNLPFSVEAQPMAAQAAATQMGGVIQGEPLKVVGGAVSTLTLPAGLRLSGPQGVATDGVNLYISDTGANVIRKMVIATGAMSVLAGSGEGSSENGVGVNASFRRPQGVTTDGSHLYVADTYSNTIRKIVLATGLVTTIAGFPGRAGSFDSKGSEARFFNPRGITTDGKKLYVTDSRNNMIRVIDIATSAVSTLAGVEGKVGHDDGVGIAASFNEPVGITTDGANLYVADTANNMIRKIVIATKEVTTLAGKVGAFGQNDGPGAGASFTGPFGVTTDGTYLYVADTYDNAIRRVDIATGLVISLAGKAPTSGKADGVGANASFARPAGVATDGKQLFILDTNNHLLRTLK
jgi:YVTN family beta-propeller protein